MSENTKIEWCDHTFNPWEGCQKVGPGCDHCYAEARNARFGGGTAPNWGPGAPRRRTSAANWKLPVKWNRQFELRQAAWDKFVSANPGMTDEQLLVAGFSKPKRPRVFCASLADVFDNEVDPQWRADLLKLIDATPNLDWLLLTKRIGNVNKMLDRAEMDICGKWTNYAPRHNIWIGSTIVNQSEADRDIPKLLSVLATKRFLSMEPLLGPVDLSRIDINGHSEIFPLTGTSDCADDNGCPTSDVPAIDWVIVGGESGSDARPMHPDWARSLRDQCEVSGVPFLFKQWGEWAPGVCATNTLEMRCVQIADWFVDGWKFSAIPGNSEFHVEDEPTLYRAGKKAAGRLLDGVQHDGFPESE